MCRTLNAGYDVVIADNLTTQSEKAVDRVKQITGKDTEVLIKADNPRQRSK